MGIGKNKLFEWQPTEVPCLPQIGKGGRRETQQHSHLPYTPPPAFSFPSSHAWGLILQAIRAQQERMWPLPGPWSNNRKAPNLEAKNKENLKVSIKD